MDRSRSESVVYLMAFMAAPEVRGSRADAVERSGRSSDTLSLHIVPFKHGIPGLRLPS
jgi:hypothetical protein